MAQSRSRERQPGLFDLAPTARPASRPADPRQPRADAEQPSSARPEPVILSVGQLAQRVTTQLKGLGRVAVEGEVCDLKRPGSGHVYFDLKDDGALIRCAIWRSRAKAALRSRLETGMRVVCHGELDLYKPRGSFSLIVDRVEQKGIGALLAQLEELKAELAAQGYFERARPLPALPRVVGVVTSRDGAAFQDFLRTRSLRWPLYPVRLAHTPVQGRAAAPAIADAIRALDRSGVDVIAVIRGGGSLEDLWGFNERPVAEAIHACRVPVVSGVGHETDVTLADMVADHRAHTPTDAGQSVLPLRSDYDSALERVAGYMSEALERVFAAREQRLEQLAQRPVLRRADGWLDPRNEALVRAERRLRLALERRFERESARVAAAASRLERKAPAARIEMLERELERFEARFTGALGQTLDERERRLAVADARLTAISPFAVLGRGYSITRKVGSTTPLANVHGVAVGDELETVLHEGVVRSTVNDASRAEEPE